VILQVMADNRSHQHIHKMSVISSAIARSEPPVAHPLDLLPEERVLAGNAYDELLTDGLIAPSYHILTDPDNYCWITSKGRALLERNLLDELDAALADIDPAFIDLRDGAHDGMRSSGPDSARQAASSARALLEQVLHKLASDDEVKRQPWWERDKTAKSGVTRKQRVRLACERRGRTDWERVASRVIVTGDDLESMKHKQGSTAGLSAEDAVRDAEIALKELLLGRSD
jgi:hypothetical protein